MEKKSSKKKTKERLQGIRNTLKPIYLIHNKKRLSPKGLLKDLLEQPPSYIHSSALL